MPEICDYEGSNYRTDFWEGKGRDYEDRAERIALRRMVPASGERLLELGAGFGRLSSMYRPGFRQVVLLDYSYSQLEYARQRLGDEGYLYVAANIYKMPFAPRLFDAATMVRVLHHMADAPAALHGVRYAMRQGGAFVLEFANKRNLKALLRWWLRRQDWNPNTLPPVEFVALNFDFHPDYVAATLREVGFQPGLQRAVSYFRLGLLKRTIPAGLLAALDGLLQPTGGLGIYAPSGFIRSEASGPDETAPDGAFWRCPDCGSFEIHEVPEGLRCESCRTIWPRRNGVYVFKRDEATES